MANNKNWGLDNPHPFSQMKTELIWEGKYDEYGNRRMVDIAGCDMPRTKPSASGAPLADSRGSPGQAPVMVMEYQDRLSHLLSISGGLLCHPNRSVFEWGR